MTRTIVATSVLCLLSSVAFADEPVLKSTSVTLPQNGATFPGQGAEAINNNCLTCHSTEMVMMQPALSKAVWAEEVAKMRKAYGAPVADQDIPAIIDYLAALKPIN